MSMANPGMMIQQVMTCPACKTDISARFSYDLTLDKSVGNMADAETDAIPAMASITGMDIKHDCIPKATR